MPQKIRVEQIVSCPKRGSFVPLEHCKKCEHYKGAETSDPPFLGQKIICDL